MSIGWPTMTAAMPPQPPEINDFAASDAILEHTSLDILIDKKYQDQLKRKRYVLEEETIKLKGTHCQERKKIKLIVLEINY